MKQQTKPMLSELSFNLHVGTIIGIEILKDYNTLLQLEYSPRELNNNHIVNVCKDLEKQMQRLLKIVSREIVNDRTESAVKEVIEWNFGITYNLLSLPLEKQKRIKNLIDKLKKESDGN